MSKDDRSTHKTEVPYGTLDLLILKTLDTMGPMHGYSIARRIEQACRLQRGTGAGGRVGEPGLRGQQPERAGNCGDQDVDGGAVEHRGFPENCAHMVPARTRAAPGLTWAGRARVPRWARSRNRFDGGGRPLSV